MLSKNDVKYCHICGALNGKEAKQCRRCKTTIKLEESMRTSQTWAYLITAMIAYIPANLYPILITKRLGVYEENTIVGGILYLWQQGSYPIALIVFGASIIVPLLKFTVLIYLLISVKYPLGKNKQKNKQGLYYFTEFIGPWSMIDVFVVAILAALVHMSSAEVLAGTAATAFGLSVFFTLLAAHSFDTKLIKDTQ